jgi:hypothetical protein
VCQESTDQLYASEVDFGEASVDTSLPHGTALPEGVSEAELCSLGGATLEDVQQNEGGSPYTADVTIPKQAMI